MERMEVASRRSGNTAAWQEVREQAREGERR
jgi:hypothetical protein